METVLTLRIDDDISDRLENLKRDKHINVSSYVRAALIAALDRDYPPLPPESLARAISHS